MSPTGDPGGVRRGWRFAIDRGGTFTDVVATAPDGRIRTIKVLSEDGSGDAAVRAIRTVLGIAPGAPIPAGAVDAVRMGTTVATNALLERTAAPVLLAVNRGFADLTVIGDQARPELFALAIRRRPPLHARVLEVRGRFAADGTEIEALDEAAALDGFARAIRDGITACAIALLHAWRFPAHEQRLASLARRAGFTQVSAGSETSPLLRLVPRAETTVVDAALTPLLRRHTAELRRALPADTAILFMQSSGGLAEPARFTGKDAILSGPAGGVVGAARAAASAGYPRVVSFDMGGTSTDVALHDGAAGIARRFETEIAGIRLRAPVLDIRTVAAGGGSIIRVLDGRLVVGPESAGAVPGPACYGRGGPVTLTDANLLLGRLRAADLPRVFGPDGDRPLDGAAALAGFAAIARQAGEAGEDAGRVIAAGALRIANEAMASAIRAISVGRGLDPQHFALASFGGAGGQHACAVADRLGIGTVLVHPQAGVLAAFGIALADRTANVVRAVEKELDAAGLAAIDAETRVIEAEARRALGDADGIATGITLHVKAEGTDTVFVLPHGRLAAIRAGFAEAHRARFGFVPSAGRRLVVENVAVEAIVRGDEAPPFAPAAHGGETRPGTTRFGDEATWIDAAVFDRARLGPGDRAAGPALIRDQHSTTVVDAGWSATVIADGHLVLRREAPATRGPGDGADAVRLALFGSLFAHAAEQAGVVLQSTAVSVNIRERLDFSCAVFDGEGRLVANAPHVPVHLGAMGETVREVLRARGGTLRPGDVIASNDPFAGGTHLPDVTAVTPVFDEDGTTIRALVASRAHHADIGGLTPGSTPPDSRRLADEGVVIDDLPVVSGGAFREGAFRLALAGGAHPARSPDLNVADLRAQIAANATAAGALGRAVAEHGWECLAGAMAAVRANAADAVRRLLARLPDGRFVDRLDDGRPIEVRVTVDRTARTAVIDFTGTGEARADNLNAPRAVTRAVVLYVVRLLAADDIPLNEGCLEPLTIVIPDGSLLAPPAGSAVVAGNTEVSQAVCNALLGAVGAAASSQATMNNLTLGDARFQYYETICGGAGAGPGFEGASAVHTHMTNTRMTDPEVVELRLPLRVERFAVRRGSGGAGRWRGGDGVERHLLAMAPMTASLVSNRRVSGPFGLAGGGAGAPGRQWVERRDGRREALGGRARVDLDAGDRLRIETPGGGGYGDPARSDDAGPSPCPGR